MKLSALLGIFLLVSAASTLALDASFTATPASGVAPLDVAFSVNDNTGITSYAWDFGDGDTSTSANPAHTYDADDIYTITLMVFNATSNATSTSQVTVDAREIVLDYDTSLSTTIYQNEGDKQIDLDIANDGNVDANVVIEFEDLTDGVNSIDALDILVSGAGSIAEGDEEQYTVTIQDIDENVVPGTYMGNYTITAADTRTTAPIAADAVVSGVLTVTVNPEPTGTSIEFVQSSIKFGDSNQEREEDIDATFTVRNSGANTVSGISYSLPSAFDRYDVQFSQDNFALAAQQQIDVTMTITIPDNQDAGVDEIGTIDLTATSPTTVSIGDGLKVNLETISHLEITEIEYDIEDGDSDNLDLDGGSDELGDDVAPGKEVILTIEVENTFDDNIDIDDVTVRIQDEDDELDFDSDREEDSQISDGDNSRFEFTFTVDSDADEDDYGFTIEVEGEDDNGAEHYAEFDVTVQVDRPSNEVSIVDMRFSPTRVTCDDDTVLLTVEIENTGSNDQSSAAVEAESDFFDFRQRDTNIDIDDGDDYTARFNIDIRDLDPGTYPIDIIAYYKLSNDDDTDNDFIDLVIGDCDDSDRDDDTDNQDNDNDNNVPPDFDDFPTGNVVYGEPDSDEPDFLILGLLAAAVLIVVILIIVLLVKATPQR